MNKMLRGKMSELTHFDEFAKEGISDFDTFFFSLANLFERK